MLIAYGRVHAIIITFGTANLFKFLGLQIFGGTTVDNIPGTLAFFGRGDAGRTLGIPHSFLIMLVIAALAWYYLRHTARGPASLRDRRGRRRRPPGRGEGAARG